MMQSGEILLSVHPWVSGCRADGWYGPVEVELSVQGMCWEGAIDAVLEEAAEQARKLGSNAVLNLEINVYPFREGGARVSLKGTAAKIAPLFADVPLVFP